MIHKLTQEQLDVLANEYGSRLLADVKKVFSKYSRTGEMEESATLLITKASDTEAPRIIVQYADQGFFIGQKNPQWTKLPNIGDLSKWSENVEFKGAVPGYKNGAPNLTPWQIKQRIVFAIAFSKKKWDTHKPKPWKRQAKLGDLLKQLNTETFAAYKADCQKILTAAIEGKQI
jgi:hypothetical protein